MCIIMTSLFFHLQQIEQAERVQSQQSAPHAAPPEEETEEEVITLQPIGPGMQNLEPDVSRDLRSPTPSFPVQGKQNDTYCIKTLKYFYIDHADQIWNRLKRLIQLFLIHLITCVMGLWPL